MRIASIVIASTFAVALTAAASAAPKGMGHGGGPMVGGMSPGASYNAPGHVKKRMRAKSAAAFAPSRAHRPQYMPPGQQRPERRGY